MVLYQSTGAHRRCSMGCRNMRLQHSRTTVASDAAACNCDRDDGTTADQLDAACEAGLEPFKAALSEWQAQRDGADDGAAEMPDWLPQLRCLVQAGVPRVRMLLH